MASVPVKRLGEVEHGLEISLCRYQVQFRYDTVSDILFRYVIGRGETGAFENGELRIENDVIRLKSLKSCARQEF